MARMIYLFLVLFCVVFPAYESVYQPEFRPAERGRPGMMIINRGEDKFDEFNDSLMRAKRAAPGAPAAATTAAPATKTNTIMPNNDWMGKNITTKVSAKYFLIAALTYVSRWFCATSSSPCVFSSSTYLFVEIMNASNVLNIV